MQVDPRNITNYQSLRNIFKGYAGMTFESISSVIHQHLDFYELILITKGEWQNRMDAVTNSMTTGTLALFKPGAIHQISTEPGDNKHFVICIEKEYFENFVHQSFPLLDIENLSECTSKILSKEKSKYIEYLGETLCKSPRPVRSMADEILYLCLSDFMYQNETLDCDAHIADIIQKLNNQSYMFTSVSDICAGYPYSQSTLQKQFKRLTGLTIVEYKAQQKMKYAEALLKETPTPIIGVATALGYDSLSYFLHAFKKQYGMTPSEYRKKYKK